MTRSELIQELNTLLPSWYNQCQMPAEPDMSVLCADFILSRERLLLEKIGKPLRAWKNRDTTEGKRWGGEIPEIDEALAIIEKESDHAK